MGRQQENSENHGGQIMEEKKIGIVTVLYNSEKVLDDFFDSLKRQTYRNFILYVVDNDSPDNSLEKARRLSADCAFKTKIIVNKENYGVAKGNNQGIINALYDECDYVLLSNNDVVLYENTISKLYDALKKENGLIGVPKILIYDNKNIWFGGGKFSKITYKSKHIGFDKRDDGLFNQKKIITYSPTCFMLIHKSVFEKIGLMDESYFVYWDDTDFVYRALQNKVKIFYLPSACMEHKESVCTGKHSDFFYKFIYRNREKFINKHSKIASIRHFIDFVYLNTVMRFKMQNNKKQWEIVRNAMKEGCSL